MGCNGGVKPAAELADNSQKNRERRKDISAGKNEVVYAGVCIRLKNSVFLYGRRGSGYVEGIISIQMCIPDDDEGLDGN